MTEKTIYIAGASGELERVNHWMKRIREAGFVVAHDWPEAIRRAGVPDHALSHGQRASYAAQDLDGVFYARNFWLLAPLNASTGAWVELGYVLGINETYNRGRQRSRVVVSGPGAARSIFAALADHERATDEEAFALLTQPV